jgi:phage shock protein PspC (stress-responsive transcriptional regulator)
MKTVITDYSLEDEILYEPPLRRSRRNRMAAGVCGGLAEWLGWDPTLVRVLFVAFAVLASPFVALAAYTILFLLIPDAKTPRETVRRYWRDLDPF